MAELGVIRGRVWKFGDNISTTDITPWEMHKSAPGPPKDIVFEAIRPDWRSKVRPGDCIVAGKNFGFGSHRAIAHDVMKDLELGCIVAESIARVYFRTVLGIGFPSFACPGVSALFEEGDELELDVTAGTVRNLTTGRSIQGKPYAPQLLEILEAGGLLALLVKRVKASQAGL
jgi:3-isopropylmalate/(R)-2-methylmalate dehydratase small subunit